MRYQTCLRYKLHVMFEDARAMTDTAEKKGENDRKEN